jgi:hypothetical protein
MCRRAETTVGGLVLDTGADKLRAMRPILPLLLVSWLAGSTGCGGAASTSDATTAPSTAGAEEIAEAESTGTAPAGAPCDYGGAERTTCQGGLVCCYPPEGEVAYGSCAAQCEGYD